MGLPRQEYPNGLPFLLQGTLPDPEIESVSATVVWCLYVCRLRKWAKENGQPSPVSPRHPERLSEPSGRSWSLPTGTEVRRRLSALASWGELSLTSSQQ